MIWLRKLDWINFISLVKEKHCQKVEFILKYAGANSYSDLYVGSERVNKESRCFDSNTWRRVHTWIVSERGSYMDSSEKGSKAAIWGDNHQKAQREPRRS